MAIRLIEECQLVKDEENISIATDGIKQAEILNLFEEESAVDLAKSCISKYGDKDEDLTENFELFIKYFAFPILPMRYPALPYH